MEDDDDMEVISNEPSELAYSHYYLPMLRSLHGLTSLDLEESDCCDKMLGEIVRCMPDLTKLAFRLHGSLGLQGSQLLKTQPVLCKGLAELRIRYFTGDQSLRRQPVWFELGGAEDLQKCEVLLVGPQARAPAMGGCISFSLDCSRSVTLKPLASSAPYLWRLGLTASRTEEHSCSSTDAEGCKHAEVSFQWAQGQCSNGSLAGMWQTTIAETYSTQRLQDQVSAEPCMPSPAEVCTPSWLPQLVEGLLPISTADGRCTEVQIADMLHQPRAGGRAVCRAGCHAGGRRWQ